MKERIDKEMKTAQKEIARQIIKVGNLLYSKGFVAANDGNISVKLSDNAFMVTPTGVSKGEMPESDMLIIDRAGKVVEGTKKPTSEIKMHLSVYEKRKDINAVVHAHPPYATAFAISHARFDKTALPEVIFSLGKIAFTRYATPSSADLPVAVSEVIGGADAIILTNHGALTCGTDIMAAYYKMETLEHFSHITFLSRCLGGEKELPKEEIAKLFEIREKIYGQSNEIFK